MPKISVVGVGGAGGNAVNNMIEHYVMTNSSFQDINFINLNTDVQALARSAATRIQIGTNLTKGFGAGGLPEIGRESALESREEIVNHLKDSDMVFITAGMGGGTGTGAAPMVAQYLQELREKVVAENGAQYGLSSLSIGVVTKPFHFEGPRKMNLAEKGLEEMKKYVDTLIVVPNQNLFRIVNQKMSLRESFLKADEVLGNAIRCISGLITDAGLINVDFADVRSVLSKRGRAVIGVGHGTGEDRAIMAALDAMSNPILDQVSFKKAKALLVSITGGDDLTLFEVDAALNRIREEIDNEANVIFGSVYDPAKTGSITVYIVATGIEEEDNSVKEKVLAPKRSIENTPPQVQKAAKEDFHAQPKQEIEAERSVEINVGDKEVNLAVNERLAKLGIYNDISKENNTNKKQAGMFSRLIPDIPAYLRRKKDK